MKIKKIILSCMLMLGFVSASAQEPEGPDYVFNPHWYVQVQPVGGQYTLGELSFSDLFSYNAHIFLEKHKILAMQNFNYFSN